MPRERLHSDNAAKQRAYRAAVVTKIVNGELPPAAAHWGRTQTDTKFERALQGRVVVYDGEGVTEDGEHRYILLVCRGPKGEIHTLYDEGRRLTTDDIFAFLCRMAGKYRNYLHIGFALTYDVTHWLYDLPRAALADAMAYKDTPRPYGEYGFKYTPRKEFYITGPEGYATIWDIFGFFQASLVRSIAEWGIEEYAALGIITTGKASRSTLIEWDIADIIRYTTSECGATAELFRRLCQAVSDVGLTLTRYDGAGAIASAMFRSQGMTRKWFNQTVPIAGTHHETVYLHDALARAYFGGRIECVQYGRFDGPIYGYDICSAYPSIIRDLPDLSRGRWEHLTGNEDGEYDAGFIARCPQLTLCQVSWSFPQDIDTLFYPFPYRQGTSVYFPDAGYGWIWRPLIGIALARPELYGTHGVDWRIEDAYGFVPLDDGRPFEWVTKAYEKRQHIINAKGDGWQGAQRVLKLGLNSLYGKMAQRQSQYYGDEYRGQPPYYNLAYAGYITAATQAQLLWAALKSPLDIIAMMTDGLFSTRPIDVPITLNKELGKWEAAAIDELVMVYSGLYYCRNGDKWAEKSRGITHAKENNERAERIWSIIDGWKRADDSITMPAKRFVGCRLASTSDSMFALRGQFVDYDRAIDIKGGGGKRAPAHRKGYVSPSLRFQTYAVGSEYGFEFRLSDAAPSAYYDEDTLQHLDDDYDEMAELWA